MGKETHSSQGSTESPIQDKTKEEHTEIKLIKIKYKERITIFLKPVKWKPKTQKVGQVRWQRNMFQMKE